jgi:DNA repair exonuclease SbcCD ATPase subunit
MANSLLADLTGNRYAIELDMQEGFQILLYDLQRQTTTDINMASASERFRVGIILQAVLSELAGLRFMIIDGIDILDQTNKGFFFDFLQKAAPQFDQIIGLGTIGQVAPRNPGIPGIDFFVLEDGKITRI